MSFRERNGTTNFSTVYKNNRGDYNSRENYVGLERSHGCCDLSGCKDPNYPYGYPTFLAPSPIVEKYKSGDRVIVNMPCVEMPANTRLASEDPDNALSYLNLKVSYAPSAGISYLPGQLPHNYLNHGELPIMNKYCI